MSETTVRQLPFHAVEESDDGRWYIIGEHRLMSVTTALNAIGKMGLMPWATRLTAEAALAELPTLVAASRKKPCDRAGTRCGHDWTETCDRCPCGQCPACVVKWLAGRHVAESSRRADEGTRVHDVAEWWSYHGEIKSHDAELSPYVKAFQAYVADYGLLSESVLMAEALLVNYEIGAAGTTDGITRFHAERTESAAKLVSRITQVPWRQAVKKRLTVDVLVDYKTREGVGSKFYPEQALQLAGYRHFPTVRIKNTDREEPMPAVDAGLIVQLRPDGYTARPVRCDRETYERGFLRALGLYQWLTEDGPAAVSRNTFVLPETVRARERKSAREAAVPADQTSSPTPDDEE